MSEGMCGNTVSGTTTTTIMQVFAEAAR